MITSYKISYFGFNFDLSINQFRNIAYDWPKTRTNDHKKTGLT